MHIKWDALHIDLSQNAGRSLESHVITRLACPEADPLPNGMIGVVANNAHAGFRQRDLLLALV